MDKVLTREYYLAHKDQIRKRVSEQYHRNPEVKRARARKYHIKNRPRILLRMAAYGVKRRAAASAKINAIKSEAGCKNCGTKDFRVLDFHHRDPGEKNFCVSHTTKGEKNTLAEAKKCDVLCANCHRIVEAEKRAK